MRQLSFIVALSILFSAWGHENFVLTKECQMFRNGDVLERQPISFIDPKESGENQFWDLSSIEEARRKKNRVAIASVNDTVFCLMEEETMYKYKFLDNTLHSIGYENRTTVLRDSVAALIMKFPFGFQQKSEGNYRYTGRYALDRDIITEGIISVEADATGRMLTPSLDTLANVLRIHVAEKSWPKLLTVYETTNDTIFRDSLEESRKDTYLWFAEGYRYPILESRRTEVHLGGKLIQKTETSYYYPPEEQLFLAYDKENQQIRQKTAYSYAMGKPANNGKSTPEDISSETIITIPEISDSDSGITVNYHLSQPAELEFLLTDLQGRVFAHIPRHSVKAGYYTQNIECPSLPPGDYLLSIFDSHARICEKMFNH